jgi:hypothetical protein
MNRARTVSSPARLPSRPAPASTHKHLREFNLLRNQ